MGMSAGQARLLSITAKLTDNELRSQMITNSKLRLSDKSSEISDKYMNSLNSQQLMLANYNDSGDKNYEKLTVNSLLSFSELKNQYCLVNSYGKILALPEDIKNYENSSSLDMFLSYYVDSTENDEYYEYLKHLYGSNYSDFFNSEDYYDIFNTLSDTGTDLINKAVTYDDITNTYSSNISLIQKDSSGVLQKDSNGCYILDITAYQELINTPWKVNAGLSGKLCGGEFGKWFAAVDDMPVIEFPEKPDQSQYQMQINTVSSLWNDFLSAIGKGGCWDEANTRPKTGNHIEHILTHLLESGETYTTSDGKTFTMLTDADGHTSTAGQSDGNWEFEQEQQAQALRNIFKSNSALSEIQQSIIDTYYKSVVMYGYASNKSAMGITGTTVNFAKTDADKQADNTEVENKLAIFNAAETLLNQFKEIEAQAQADKDAATADYNDKKALYEASIGTSMEEQCKTDMLAAKTVKTNAETAYNTAKTNRENYESGNYINAKNDYDAAVAEQAVEYKVCSASDTGNDARLMAETVDLLDRIKNAVQYQWVDDTAAFANAVASYNSQILNLQSQLDSKLVLWAENIENKRENFKTELDKLNNIPLEALDKNDSKYQWYKNLWFRMGSGEKQNYKEIDLNLINNSEWLQFALEHGILTLEQAVFSETGSLQYPEIGTYDWESVSYTNAPDFVSQENESAIALAEAKYKNEMQEIENKDKKYDQDLKKLDTEHSALQTEYESLKSTIDKNVERSFKAFS